MGENNKWLNTQSPAQGIKNTIAKVRPKMLNAYNQIDSLVLTKSNIVMCVQPLSFVPLSPGWSGNSLGTTLDATYNDNQTSNAKYIPSGLLSYL